MQQSVNERVKFLVDGLCEGNVSRFAKEIGVSHTSINTLMPGERESKPGFETIAKISTRYPEINVEWLIKGEGEPFKREGQQRPQINSGTINKSKATGNTVSVGTVSANPGNSEVERLRERVQFLEQKNNELLDKNSQLLEKIMQLLTPK